MKSNEMFEVDKPFPTAEDDLARILSSQEKEVLWWKDKPEMTSREDLDKALESGQALLVPEAGTGYRISGKVPKEFRILEKNTLELLRKISGDWASSVVQKKDEEIFLVVSSLARTTDYQRKLIAAGYPAAEHSTHTKLGAFDIAFRWMEENRPDALENLHRVIESLVKEGRVNFIVEEAVGVYHIASNPTLNDNSER